MRIHLKLVLNCPPDAAWRALRSPTVFRAVSWPLTTFESLEADGFPELWAAGEHPVRGRAFGLLPMGDQLIDISFPPAPEGVRWVRDSGRGLTGPLAVVTQWRHTMAVSEAPGGRTLFRDELRFGAGPITPLLWPVFWVFWQWRAARLRSLAPRWA
jgi:hypothetical protein